MSAAQQTRRAVLPLVLAAFLAVGAAAAEARPDPGSAGSVREVPFHLSEAERDAFTLVVPQAALRTARAAPAARQAEAVGDVRLWPALDRRSRNLYPKEFTLRALGRHIEVWVASGADGVSRALEFPAGDCRNDDRVTLGDSQAQLLAQQFDDVIHPRSAQAFSEPTPRDGRRATLPRSLGVAADYYVGDGARVVALVDNIRDEAFFDVNVRGGVGGVFVPSLDAQVDRNVITVDGVDWLHRTGASPPHDPVQGDLCRSRSARPFLIEATFAHEYQHLLQSFQDSDETTWVNEGLSMYAEQVTGYTDLRRPITDIGFSGSLQCLLGNTSRTTSANPNPTPGGAENSLTAWGDKGDQQIVCDYGAAETFMHLLAARFGQGFLTALHRDRDNGLASVRKLAAGARADVGELVREWAVLLALDGVLDRGYRLAGGNASRYRVPTIDGAIAWENAQSYAKPGAPPNGSDYVRLVRNGRPLASGAIRSIAFDGSAAAPRRPVEWRVDPSPLDRAGDAALHSGSGGGLDRGIVRRVSVPRSGARLEFATRYDLAPGLDVAAVQVSADAGRTWRSVRGNVTTRSLDPTAGPKARRSLPALTGRSGGGRLPRWVDASYDLAAYRGRTVLLAFRLVTDSRVTFPGWWIDDVRLAGRPLSNGGSLAGWQSLSRVSSEPADGFTVQLVGISDAGRRALVHRMRLDGRLRGELSGATLRRLLAPGYELVAAIVTHDDPTGTKVAYAPYTLRVNGVVQPGGRR